MDCVFCRIIAGQSPAAIVYQNDNTIAFMDVYPVARGHILVVPKNHVVGLFDISPEECAQTMHTAVMVAKAIRDSLKPDGLNLWQSTGRAANQSVFHFHVHLIPRWYGDGLNAPHGKHPTSPQQLAATAAQIQACLPTSDA
ncbi:MAG: HIT family protein [Chloroflexi bacterium]|nr:HIT family protein [Chloroflexota bacterium]